MIDPDSAQEPYEQLAVILRDEIAQGYLTGKVPSEHEIGERHGVSHRVAARALSILEGEGLLVKVAGEGHYVRERT
jgi:GntR family transcriptional regulator